VASVFNVTAEKAYSMAESRPRCATKPGWFTKAITCLTAVTTATIGKAPTVVFLGNHESTPSIPTPAIQNKTILPGGITIYGDAHAVDTFTGVVNEFPDLWNDTGKFIEIPESEWMTIPLRSD
jgi:hypothetical protein